MVLSQYYVQQVSVQNIIRDILLAYKSDIHVLFCVYAYLHICIYAYFQKKIKAGIRCVPQAGRLSLLAFTPFTLDAR